MKNQEIFENLQKLEDIKQLEDEEI